MRKLILAASLAALSTAAAAQVAGDPATAEAAPPAAGTTPAPRSVAPLHIDARLAQPPSEDPLVRLGIRWRTAWQHQAGELLIAALLAGGLAVWLWQALLLRRHLRQAQQVLELSHATLQAGLAASDAGRSLAEVMQKAQQPVLALADVLHTTFNIDPAHAAHGERTAFQLRWKNFGHTPALRCTLSAAGHVFPAAEPLPPLEPLNPRSGPSNPATTLGADALASAPACVFSQDIVQGWERREHRLVLQALCACESVFAPGELRTETVAVELIPSGRDREGRLRFQWAVLGPADRL